MKSRFRNIFLVFGIVAVVIMLFTFDVSYEELLNNLKRAGIYLPLVLLLWLVLLAGQAVVEGAQGRRRVARWPWWHPAALAAVGGGLVLFWVLRLTGPV